MAAKEPENKKDALGAARQITRSASAVTKFSGRGLAKKALASIGVKVKKKGIEERKKAIEKKKIGPKKKKASTKKTIAEALWDALFPKPTVDKPEQKKEKPKKTEVKTTVTASFAQNGKLDKLFRNAMVTAKNEDKRPILDQKKVAKTVKELTKVATKRTKTKMSL